MAVMSTTMLLITHLLAFSAGGVAVVGLALLASAKGNADERPAQSVAPDPIKGPVQRVTA